jgi:hypothetical protein
MSLMKKSRNRLLTRAAQIICTDFAKCYRAVTVRERSAATLFQQPDSCLHFKCRGPARHGSNFHGSIVSRRLMNNGSTSR